MAKSKIGCSVCRDNRIAYKYPRKNRYYCKRDWDIVNRNRAIKGLKTYKYPN